MDSSFRVVNGHIHDQAILGMGLNPGRDIKLFSEVNRLELLDSAY